jgi:hypothetical protein
MRIKALFVRVVVCLLFILIILSGSIMCSGQLQWQMSVQIGIHTDGSATWVIQQRTTLATSDDEAEFFQYLNITSLDTISSHVNSMVDQAALVTGRSMRVENLQMTANITTQGLKNEGILQYDFDWIGFAEKTGNDSITVGDSLSGTLDLSPNDMLTIEYPSGYAPTFVYPTPDQTQDSDMRITWFGPRNFGAGEPHASFERTSLSWTDAIMGDAGFIAAAVSIVSASLLGYLLGSKRLRLNRTQKPIAEQKPVFPAGLSVEDDEEKVVKLLAAAGGRMQQLAITRQCGFSKSKASEVLSVLERRGVVTRRKVGRGKIVTLVERQEG